MEQYNEVEPITYANKITKAKHNPKTKPLTSREYGSKRICDFHEYVKRLVRIEDCDENCLPV